MLFRSRLGHVFSLGSDEKSFNAIVVDSDTSTSDTVLLAATSQVPHEAITEANDARAVVIQSALGPLCLDLGHQVVRRRRRDQVHRDHRER